MSPTAAAVARLEKRVLTLFKSGDLAASESAALGIAEASPSHARLKLYLLAQIELRRANYDKAIVHLLEARERHGDHISVLTSLAVCYYMSDQAGAWRATLEELMRVYPRVASSLSQMRRARTCLRIAQFLEEEGRVAEALHWYEECLPTIDRLELPNDHCELSIQVLRLKCSFRDRSGVAELYARFLATDPARITPQVCVDLEHALTLAELEILGTKPALERLKAALASPSLNDADRNLLYFDVAEEFILRGRDPAPLLALKPEGSPNAYETLLLRLLADPAFFPSHLELASLARQIPFASQLRIVALAIQRSQEPETRQLFLFLLESLSAESRSLWQARSGGAMAQATLALDWNGRASTLTFQGRILDLSRKTTLAALIALVSGTGPEGIALDAVIHALWNVSGNESYYHRLRNLVQRINSEISSLTGIPGALRLTQERVLLNPSILIRSG